MAVVTSFITKDSERSLMVYASSLREMEFENKSIDDYFIAIEDNDGNVYMYDVDTAIKLAKTLRTCINRIKTLSEKEGRL